MLNFSGTVRCHWGCLKDFQFQAILCTLLPGKEGFELRKSTGSVRNAVFLGLAHLRISLPSALVRFENRVPVTNTRTYKRKRIEEI